VHQDLSDPQDPQVLEDQREKPELLVPKDQLAFKDPEVHQEFRSLGQSAHQDQLDQLDLTDVIMFKGQQDLKGFRELQAHQEFKEHLVHRDSQDQLDLKVRKDQQEDQVSMVLQDPPDLKDQQDSVVILEDKELKV